MLIAKEVRRYFLRSKLQTTIMGLIILLGMTASSLMLSLLLSLENNLAPGLRHWNYQTIAEALPDGGAGPISWKQAVKVRDSNRTGVAVAISTRAFDIKLRVREDSSPAKAVMVSRGFFSIFTRPLSAGRDFTATEEVENSRHVLVISHAFAARFFSSPQNAVGRYVFLNQHPFEIIGVAPKGFTGALGEAAELWLPAHCIVPVDVPPFDSQSAAYAESWKLLPDFYVLAGSPQAAALANFINVLPQPDSDEAVLGPFPGLTSNPVRDTKLRHWFRLGIFLSLAFISTALFNYGGLLFARMPVRLEEMRLKSALGAQPSRLLLDLLIGPATFIVAAWAISCALVITALLKIAGLGAFYQQIVLGSWRQASFALGLEGALVVLFTGCIALLPATHLLRESSAPRSAHTMTSDKSITRGLQAVVVLQIAACITIWILAGMVLIAVQKELHRDPGYRPESLSVVRLAPGRNGLTMKVSAGKSFPLANAVEGIVEQVSSLPGVRSVSVAMNAPLDRPFRSMAIAGTSATTRYVACSAVSQTFFQTIGAQFLRGHGFSSRAFTGEIAEAVVDQAMARELAPDGSVLNRTLVLTAPATGIEFHVQITGVIRDMDFTGLGQGQQPVVFLPLKGLAFTLGFPLYVITEGKVSLPVFQEKVSRPLGEFLPDLETAGSYSVRDRLHEMVRKEHQREYLSLSGAFLIGWLASMGLLASLSHYVSMRRREFAVRICFGASARDLRFVVIRQAWIMATLGGCVSLLSWPWLAHMQTTEWMGHAAWSPGLALLLSFLCIFAAVLIALVPSEAVTRIAPQEILKEL